MDIVLEIINSGKSDELSKLVFDYERLVSNRKENKKNVKKG